MNGSAGGRGVDDAEGLRRSLALIIGALVMTACSVTEDEERFKYGSGCWMISVFGARAATCGALPTGALASGDLADGDACRNDLSLGACDCLQVRWHGIRLSAAEGSCLTGDLRTELDAAQVACVPGHLLPPLIADAGCLRVIRDGETLLGWSPSSALVTAALEHPDTWEHPDWRVFFDSLEACSPDDEALVQSLPLCDDAEASDDGSGD